MSARINFITKCLIKTDYLPFTLINTALSFTLSIFYSTWEELVKD